MAQYGYIKPLISIFFFAFSLISFSLEASEHYGPSYPDIWGYDLSDTPAFKSGQAGIEAYAMDDGDIWFLINSALTTKKTYLLIKFFKGEKLEFSEKNKNKIFDFIDKQHAFLPSLDNQGITFSNGSNLSLHYRSTPKACYIPTFDYGWLLKISNNNIQDTYIILSPLSQVEMHPDQALCEAKGAPFFYEKLSMVTNIIPLKDETFIAFSNQSGLILRFNKDLKSEFKPASFLKISDKNYIPFNFYVINYSVVDQLKNQFSQLPVPLYQSIHDALLLHLHNAYNH